MLGGIIASIVGWLLVNFMQHNKAPEWAQGATAAVAIVVAIFYVAADFGFGRWQWGANEVVEEPMAASENEDPERQQGQSFNGRPAEQLNIIVFNAIRTTPAERVVRTDPVIRVPDIDRQFYWTVNQLKRIFDDCSVDAREYWTGRRYRQKTEIYYNGARAAAAARSIADLLPGDQIVHRLESTDLWGIHPDRDIVMLIGRDAWYITDGLSSIEESPECPRLVG